MKYALFGGNGTMGKWVRKAISQNDPTFELVYVGDNNTALHGQIIDGIEIIDAVSFAEKYHNSEIDIVILAVNRSWHILSTVIEQLYKLGIDNMYILPQYLYEWDENCFNVKDNLIKIDPSKPCYSGHLNLSINKHCNLNCTGCGMFSNLYTEPCCADFKQYKKDLSRIKELFWDVQDIIIFGGEPLLNENIEDYIILSRTMFPSSTIEVETNGILLLNCDDTLLQTMHDNHAAFRITPYTILENQKINILSRLKAFNIHYSYRADNTNSHGLRASFYKFLDGEGSRDPDVAYSDCTNGGHCYNWHLREGGDMSGCQFPLYIDKFNEVFSDVFTITEKDTINIHHDIEDGYQLLTFLSSSKPFCRYCAWDKQSSFTWSQGTESKMSDWLVNEVE